MKITKFITFLIFLSVFSSSYSQLHSKVDERFELTSIAFRLADAKEYVNNQIQSYAEDIDSYFGNYKDHELIKFCKEVREKDLVAFDAISSSTSLLKIKGNGVILNPNVDVQLYLKKESRWKENTLRQYVKLLDKFYKDTKFKRFFNEHKDLYASAERNMDNILVEIDTDWFSTFFGKPFDIENMWIGLANGPHNYAVSSYDKTKYNAGIIIGCSRVDSDGNPTFDVNKILPTIIHELCHNFANPLVDKYKEELLPSAELIFPHVKDQLAQYAYGKPESVLYEGFTNLCKNIYFQSHTTGFEGYNIGNDEKRGFIWMHRMLTFAEAFNQNRSIYPDFDSFMPQMVGFMNNLAQNIESEVFEFQAKQPRVVSTFPENNTTVSHEIREIIVNFSQPMMTNAKTLHLIDNDSITLMPISGIDAIEWRDEKIYVYKLNKLEPGKQYGFKIPALIFTSAEGARQKEDCSVIFKTK